MDEDFAFSLLETKLKLCDNLYFNDLDKLKARNGDLILRSNVKSIDLRKYLKQPCTPDSELVCPQTKLALKQDFQEFKSWLNDEKSDTKNSSDKISTTKTLQKNFEFAGNKKSNNVSSGFVTATEELNVQMINKYGHNNYASSSGGHSSNSQTAQKSRKLGLRSRGVNKRFISPLLSTNDSDGTYKSEEDWPMTSDKYTKNIDPKMIEMIQCEIMDTGAAPIKWNDIAGLQFAKSVIQEAVIWPILRPDIFNGLRRPPKGILLFGPPGTGKTLIGKCIATESKSTFFSISASSLTSKWIGDGEKMVRALFAVARSHQPSVIFIDEIDSLLSQRSDTEHESSRRMKTEFLVQLDGATTDSEERLLLVGATNRPQELDEAARRRFVKRLYIPLPEYEARLELLKKLISGENHVMTDHDFEEVARLSEGYSGADVRSLCAEASLGPIRSISMEFIEKIQAEEVRPLMMEDFQKAFLRVKSSVSSNDLEQFIEWNKIFGCGV